ncbi:hypothetical protein HHL28_11220 [Aerophototrophica crusticola]|uniref:Uncharacterized protein n=1 Tax=Aerophototrophica crusticola TaxID=1709002 RepID=A0A858R7N1_9PROT|nr:hypothetical protein HHL28_11215 [Rhodospirillaceae bacterium B3]QJE73580.1 hypothetical protein HHL28_11220 [Rhodospirillaceae bacterium B3]
MDISRNALWRKTTDIKRQHAVFELVHDSAILLDMGLSDNNVIEICFHGGICSATIDLEDLLSLIENGKKLIDSDR